MRDIKHKRAYSSGAAKKQGDNVERPVFDGAVLLRLMCLINLRFSFLQKCEFT